jgi:hypothetical protein
MRERNREFYPFAMTGPVQGNSARVGRHQAAGRIGGSAIRMEPVQDDRRMSCLYHIKQPLKEIRLAHSSISLSTLETPMSSLENWPSTHILYCDHYFSFMFETLIMPFVGPTCHDLRSDNYISAATILQVQIFWNMSEELSPGERMPALM